MHQIATLFHGGGIKFVLVTVALLGAVQFLRSAGSRYQYAMPRFGGLTGSGPSLLKEYKGEWKMVCFLSDLQQFFPRTFSDDDFAIISGFLKNLPIGTILKMYPIPVTICPDPDTHAGLAAQLQDFSVMVEYSAKKTERKIFRSTFGLPQEPFEFPDECFVEDYGRQRIVFARPTKSEPGNVVIAFVPRYGMPV